MKKPTILVPLSFLVLATASCGGNVATEGPATTSGTGASSAEAGAGATTGSGASTGSGGIPGDTVTLTMDTFTVPPGAEVYKCQNFANPFGNADAEVAMFESHMTPGSHHLLLFYKQGATDSSIMDCSGLEFAATPYSTQLPDDTVAFPDGVAALIQASTGLRLQSHYLNTTAEPIEAHVEVTFHLAKQGTVNAHAGVLFVVEPKISIAPSSTGVVKHNCALPFDMNLIKAGSHMHKHGIDFSATIGAETVFQTMQWDEPKPALFMPPKPVKGGAPLSFQCTFKNDTAQTLTFGESAETNEMCIFVSSFYPVPSDALVTVGCQ